MLCTKIDFRKSRKRLWAINFSAVNSVSRFSKLFLLFLFVRLFVVVQSISVIFDPSQSFFQLFYFSLVKVSMTNRKYVFNWLYYLLWNFSTCICPVGMEKVSTELITKAFFQQLWQTWGRYTKCKKTLRAHSFIIIMVWSSPFLFLEILSHVSAEIVQLREITLSARYGQYQGWLTTVRFQKYLVDSTSHTTPSHSPRYFQLHQSGWVLLSLSWFWEFFNFES